MLNNILAEGCGILENVSMEALWSPFSQDFMAASQSVRVSIVVFVMLLV